MTVTDQLKIIDNKIKTNQAQYDLDRLTAKISVNSTGDLKKYEYLTGEDLGYKPSVFEQAKFDTKGLGKNDKKEGLFKRLENIKDKNEELLKAFSTANRVSKTAKNQSDFNYDSRYAFYRFYRDFENFKRMVSIDSKYGELKEFYILLSNFKNHKPIATKTRNRKDRILNNVNQLYNKYLDTYKKNYDSEDLNERDAKLFDPNQFEILGKKKLKSESTEEDTNRESQKRL